MEPDRFLLPLGDLHRLAGWFLELHQGLPRLGVERGDTLAVLTKIPIEEAGRALRAAGINPKRSRWGGLAVDIRIPTSPALARCVRRWRTQTRMNEQRSHVTFLPTM